MSDQMSLDLALLDLRRLVELGFSETNGQNALILQRMDQADGRHIELVRRIDTERAEMVARYNDVVERVQVLERDAVTKTQLAERTRQIIAVVGLLVTVAGVVIALVFGIVQV
ncbi:hypothetical protein ACGFIV_01030 [Sphaerisporangium sp. NPDC049003]|uniref:hypothetical protein n=1 Tax=Sphaerisporangium sp. NPDC049003 TaxID=3364517 RepID=UPI003713D115